jgi:predicted RNA-binding Zn-ribbon protein involved in translation (DUF1610 family)
MAQTCPTCSKSLADGTSVVFKDDKLIHARCWADRPVESTEEARKPPRTTSGKEAPSKDATGRHLAFPRGVSMVECPQCAERGGTSVEAAVEIHRWTTTGVDTRYRCPRCGWEGSQAAGCRARDARGTPDTADTRRPRS